MKKFTFKVKDKQGIHARPAGIVVQEARKYKSNIIAKFDGKTADLKRIFTVMALCAKCGSVLEIEVSGADEEAAAKAISKILESQL